MCGISGIVNTKKGISISDLKKMTDVIAHRGPDGEGHWVNEEGNVGLGHRRLSIIDLSLAASQPMLYQGRYTIVFNGEIYNYVELKEQCQAKGYRFTSDSDTEVLMALYDWKKEKLLELLDGMFAFSIYDRNEETLFCARDRFGEKPFFYSYRSGSYFVFGSEMKAVWAGGIPKKVNHKMLFNYLAFNLLENPSDLSETFYENCTRLPHAHCLILDTKSCTIKSLWKYYDIDWRQQNHNIKTKQANQRLTELMYESVRRRLRSDVPIGSSLSGGLDSSIIVCIIDQIKKNSEHPQNTFSARFPGFYKDEGRYMNMIVNQTNVTPHFTYPSEETFAEIFPVVWHHQEEPFSGNSVLAQYEVMRLAKEHGVTVLLDGQGADEVFAGYHHYYYTFFKELHSANRKKYVSEFNAYSALMQENNINIKFKYTYYNKYKEGLKRLYSKVKNAYVIEAWFKRKFPWVNLEYFPDFNKYIYVLDQENSDTLNEALYRSLFSGGLQQLLRFADRNSMAHSREVRLPFLFHELVEYIFSLDSELKIHNGWTKYILRETYESLLPPEVCWRKDKIGFAAPAFKMVPGKREMQRSVLVNEKWMNKMEDANKLAFCNYLMSKL